MKCELFFCLLLGIINQGFTIRITRFVVPTVASYGSLVNLDCAYDLENDRLYDVKWYKDSDEFFRCKSDGQVQGFEVEGIDLYKSHRATIGSCPVTITILNSKSAGKYLCEISSEAPEFKTTARWVNLRISNNSPAKRIQPEDGTTSTTNLPASTEASTLIHGSGCTKYFCGTTFAYMMSFIYFLLINFNWMYLGIFFKCMKVCSGNVPEMAYFFLRFHFLFINNTIC